MTAEAVLALKVVTDTKGTISGVNGVTDSTTKMGKAGSIAGKALAVGLLAAGAAAVKATQAAAEDDAAATKLANTLRNATGARAADVAATEKWISAQGTALGVSDDELRPAIGKLAAATGDLSKAQELASLAMNISAGTGKSLSAVTAALAKAQNGSVGGLAKYDVATKNADGSARSLNDIQKDLAKTYSGAAAKGAETAAGKQKILSVQFGELQEQIGAKLLPVMLALVGVGLQVVGWISQNTTVAGILIGTIGGLLAITFAVSKAMQVWSAITKVAAGVQAAFNLVMAANPVVLVVLAIVALGVALVVAYKKSETFRNVVNAVFKGISATVGAVVGFIRDNWKKLLVILTGPIGLAVVVIASNWDKIKAGGVAVIGWVKTGWSTIKNLISTPVDQAGNLVDKVWTTIKNGFTTVKNGITGAVGDIKTSVVNGFNAILAPIQAVIDKVQGVIDKIKSIPTPKLPDLNPFNGRTAASSTAPLFGVGASRVAAAAGTGQSVVNITVQGAVDPRATAEQIATILRRQGYRIGKAVG